MKGKDLLEAMEYLEDDIIEAASEDIKKHTGHRVFISLAACLACVFLLWYVGILPAVKKAHKGDSEPVQSSAENNNWEEIFVPSAYEMYLSEDMRVVSKDDLWSFNLKWEEIGEKQWKNNEDFEFFYDFMNTHKIQVSGKALYPMSYYDIGGEEIDFSVIATDSSMSAVYMLPTLHSQWVYSSFHMKQYDSDRLLNYFTQIEEKKAKTQEQTAYLAKHLSEEDYGGCYYDSASEKFIVWLVNENYRKELEQQEMICETANYSIQQLYEKMHELWEKKEELGIVEISINFRNNHLSVFGELKEKEFQEKLENTDWNQLILYNELIGNTKEERRACLGMSGAIGIEDADEFIKFLQAVYANNHQTETPDISAQQYFDDLRTALVKLKERYPEYTLLQLYYHVSTDCDYEYYLKFERNLENFVNTLPAYKKDMDFLREQQYGDPQRLGLKAVLYYYKQLYPKMTYQDLYETYLIPQKLEQNSSPKVETLYKYLYIKANQKEELKEKQQQEANAFSKELHYLFYLFLSCIMMFFLLSLCAFFKKKHMEKPEFRKYLIRETVALFANITLFIIFPHILFLMADPTDMMAVVFLPNYYLGPLFGLIGSAIYTHKKGSWWTFILYTIACLFLESLAVAETASDLYIFLLYILPAEIIGTIFIKLRGRIKIIK